MSRKSWLIWMAGVLLPVVLSGCGESIQSNSIVTDELNNQTMVSDETPDVSVAFGTSGISDKSVMPNNFATQKPIEELFSEDESDILISKEEISEGAAEDEPVGYLSEKPYGNTAKDKTKDYNVIELDAVKYAKSDVNVRQGPSTDYPRIGSLSANVQVKVTGQADSTGWYRIIYNDVAGFVSNNYLVDEKVSVTENGEQNPDNNEIGVILQTAAYEGDTGNEKLNQLCDDILINIVNDDMSEREKAYAVYTWVTNNIKYRGTSATGDWIAGAETALTKRSGNCYTFYSASRALLTRLGFENIEAVSYTEGHYWNMVKVDGSWWHFDTTTGWGTERFLWTSEQLLNYTYRNIAYLWNPEGYPQTP